MKTFSELISRDPFAYNGVKDYSHASNHWLRMAAFSPDYIVDPGLFDEVLSRSGLDIDTALFFFNLYEDLDFMRAFFVAAHEIDDNDDFWLDAIWDGDRINAVYPAFSDDEENASYTFEKAYFYD